MALRMRQIGLLADLLGQMGHGAVGNAASLPSGRVALMEGLVRFWMRSSRVNSSRLVAVYVPAAYTT